MRSAGRMDSEWKRVELQLDTAQILLVVAMLVGLCAASFYLGRWIERDRWQDVSGRKSPAAGAIPESDAGADLTFFDRLGGQTAEPSRQARPSPVSSSPHSASGAASSSETAEGADAGAGSPAGSRDASSAAPSGSPSSAARKSAPSSSSSKPGGTGSGWAIQVFAGDRAQAEKIAVSLSQQGYATRLVPGSSGPRSAKVRVVGYGSRSEAQKGAERLRRESDLKPWVVKPD